MDIGSKMPAFNPEYVDEGAPRQKCRAEEGRAIGATPTGPSDAEADDEDSTPAFRSGWTTTPKMPKVQGFVPATPATEPQETGAQRRRRDEGEVGGATGRERVPRLAEEEEEEEAARREAERSAIEETGAPRSEAEMEGPTAAVVAAVDNLRFVREDESFERPTVDAPGPADARLGDGAAGRGGDLARQVGGAAVAGAVAGLAVSGAVVVGVAAGGAAAYTAARSPGAAGDAARRTGERVAAAGDRAKEMSEKHNVKERSKVAARRSLAKAKEVDEKHGLVEKSRGAAQGVATAARGVNEKHRVAEKTKVAARATTKKVASGVKFISKSMTGGKKSADDGVPAG